MQPPTEPIVRLCDLSKSFEEAGGSRPVLRSLDAEFGRGDFAVLIGRSGSGKSTLLNLISGIEKPSAGQVWVADRNLTALSDRERTLFRRDHIGIVFQFFNLIPTLTVLENVTLPLELAGRSGAQVTNKAKGLLAEVGLAVRGEDFPDRLSGGEQQRVAIARALAADPMLLLADEPTGNLDEETGRRVLALLLDMTRASGKTMIMATHNPELIPLADRVYTLHDGRLSQKPGRLASR
ncbi:MAG: ABC transporter ATP-binding protein [Candidatus Promineifilaceae bacterium]